MKSFTSSTVGKRLAVKLGSVSIPNIYRGINFYLAETNQFIEMILFILFKKNVYFLEN